jgi:hypothetical protein
MFGVFSQLDAFQPGRYVNRYARQTQHGQILPQWQNTRDEKGTLNSDERAEKKNWASLPLPSIAAISSSTLPFLVLAAAMEMLVKLAGCTDVGLRIQYYTAQRENMKQLWFSRVQQSYHEVLAAGSNQSFLLRGPRRGGSAR